MLILQSLAKQPLNWRKLCTPSNILMCVKPISLMNSSFECSERVGIVLVTRNMVLMMSCDEYPRSLSSCISDAALYSLGQGNFAYQSSRRVSTALSSLPSQHALIMAWTLTGCGLSTTLNTLSPLTKPKPAQVLCRLLSA